VSGTAGPASGMVDVDALLMLERAQEARGRFEALLAMAVEGTFPDNFPPAFTHLGLVQSALMVLYEAGGREAILGTHADRGRRITTRHAIGRRSSMVTPTSGSRQ
jgi:alpha,alpha-trehalase